MTLASKILLGLTLGILAGIVVGEPLGALQVLGDAFVRLLQMTVLPYIVVSLIAGLGRLDMEYARRMGLWGGGLLLLIWTIMFAVVAVMPLSFPTLETASFYSSTLEDRSREIDFVGLYIPSNPFHSLANNIVPSAVVFSIAVGIALIGVPDRQSLLRGLDTLAAALLRVNDFVVRLTPAGVFFIAASAAGTMSIEEFQRVQVYLISYALFALLATFWILPGLLAALTPVRHRDALGATRGAMLTAFATGSSFVVIPLLAAASKDLIAPHVDESEEADSLIDVTVPATHTFPHAAKVLTLSFILFAGWSVDAPVPLSDYPLLAVSGIASTFGSVNAAVPFLLDLMLLPHDGFQLFVATSVINARFGTLLQSMHVLVLTLLVTAALSGCLALSWWRLARYAAITAAIVVAAVVSTRALYATVVDTSYRKGEVLGRMQLARGDRPTVVHREPPAVPLVPGSNRLQRILSRGSLRVGYRLNADLPFSYFNDAGELVGLDTEMAHSLARGLGVELEFVPLDVSLIEEGMSEPLDSGYCDIVMSQAVVSMAAATELSYSRPYLELNLGFLVRDHRRQEFTRREVLAERDDLRLAMPGDRYYRDRIAGFLPKAELIPVREVEEFLDDDRDRFDAMVFVAEAASAWSILRPEFGVVVPEPPLQKLLLAYPLPLREPEWQRTVDAWIQLKRTDGTIERLYDYWILGREAEQEPPRWSVLRNVLGWLD